MSLPSLKLSWNRNMRQEFQEIAPGLFLGSAFSSNNVDQLKTAGITNLVCIYDSRETRAMENLVAYRKKEAAPGLEVFKKHYVEVNVEKKKGFIRAFSKVEELLLPACEEASRVDMSKTLVYCTTGIAVSPPFVVMHLMKRFSWDPVYAMEYVCDRRACVYFTEPAQKAIFKFGSRLSLQAEIENDAKLSNAGHSIRSSKRKREDSDSDSEED
ncbi:hypothetical protein PQX77_002800 [Marasmius sp. AFHP31]|nr:hypothetical protein PQX77_002800 [Marasmius sp. AFHP31]